MDSVLAEVKAFIRAWLENPDKPIDVSTMSPEAAVLYMRWEKARAGIAPNALPFAYYWSPGWR